MTLEDALRNAAAFRVAGADVVKLEGGGAPLRLISILVTDLYIYIVIRYIYIYLAIFIFIYVIYKARLDAAKG